MANVYDVAQYILEQKSEITAIKLQKLVYYCQAWALVWIDGPLFPDSIEAWANGPVVPALYLKHRTQYNVTPNEQIGKSGNLNEIEKKVIDSILAYYGDKTAHYLVELTHLEYPWKQTRTDAGVFPGERCDAVIPHAYMADYYSSLIQ